MRKKKGRKSLLFSLFCYFPVVEKDPSGILYIGIPHLFQQAGGLTASAAGAAVYKKRSILLEMQGIAPFKCGKGSIFAAGNMAFPVFLGSANIQQDGSVCLPVIGDCLIDIRCFEKIKKSHSEK